MHCARFFFFSLTAALHWKQCGDSFTVLQFFSFYVNTIHLFFYLTKDSLYCKRNQAHECSYDNNRNKEEEEKGSEEVPSPSPSETPTSLPLSLFPCEKPAQRTQRETTDRPLPSSSSSLCKKRRSGTEQHRIHTHKGKKRVRFSYSFSPSPFYFPIILFYSTLFLLIED